MGQMRAEVEEQKAKLCAERADLEAKALEIQVKQDAVAMVRK
jgi:hypothetical protein